MKMMKAIVNRLTECARCHTLTDVAIEYRPHGPLGAARKVCLKHLPKQGRRVQEHWDLIQRLVNG